MKKICTIFLLASFIIAGTSACTHKQKPNMVQSHRRFEKYMNTQNNNGSSTVVDLSEGPRQNYDRNLGPQNLNFDIKIVDPY